VGSGTREEALQRTMQERKITVLHEALQRKKDEILEAHRKTRMNGRQAGHDEVQDEGDKATSAHAREFLFSLSESERRMLQQVEEAIARIPGGNFGICKECGEPIDSKRLQAVPWAQRCLACQEQQEQLA
jgi:DnaK suppressor protein